MKLIIQGTLPDLNTYINAERTNKFMAAKIKKEATEFVAWLVNKQRIGKITEPISEVKIDWYVKDLKKDADNIVFAKKFILDGLVASGALPNDGRKYITAFNEKVFVDKNERIDLTIN